MELRPHDLLRLGGPGAIEATDAPDWVAESLRVAPWVVVRRAGLVRGRCAIGVRGSTRAERFGAFLAPEAIVERLSPEDLVDRAPLRAHPAFAAMAQLRPRLDELGLVWGPAGAAGYELASRRAALHAESDLDLVVRVVAPPSRAALAAVAAAASRASVRIDVLLETPRGAVALDELLRHAPDILLRTSAGPRLAARGELFCTPC